MLKSNCRGNRPKLNLKGIQRETENKDQSDGITYASKSEPHTMMNSAPTSPLKSEEDDSDFYDSDWNELDARERVASGRETPKSVCLKAKNEESCKLLEHQTCSSSFTKRDRGAGSLAVRFEQKALRKSATGYSSSVWPMKAHALSCLQSIKLNRALIILALVHIELVASNDLFTPRPTLPRPASTGGVVQSCLASDRSERYICRGFEYAKSCQDMGLRMGGHGETDPHYDSLRSRFATKSTPRQSAVEALKASFATPLLGMGTPRHITPRIGNISTLGFKERVNNFTRMIQQSYSSERRTCRSSRANPARDLELQLLEHGITPVYQPENWAEQPPPKVIADITDVRSFLSRSAPEGCAPTRCHVRRQFRGGWIFPRYKLYLTDGHGTHFLLSARKRKKSVNSNYIFSLDEEDISRRTGNYFGKLRSNFMGTQFWFYDKGGRPSFGRPSVRLSKRIELGAVTYQNNPLGLKGPRKMTVILPDLDNEGKPYVHRPGPKGSHSILTKYRSGQDQQKMIVMHNRQPVWNKEKGCYVLNFNGRVTRPSVKNFQLVADVDPGKTVMQFGKVGTDAYNMDYTYPLSALQAFAISLSSVDNKIACE